MNKKMIAMLVSALIAAAGLVFLCIVLFVQKAADVTAYYAPICLTLLGVCGMIVMASVKLD